MSDSTLSDYWGALYSRKWIILAVAVSATVFTVVISHRLPPIYEAKASFYFPTNLQATSYTTPVQQSVVQPPLRPLPDEKEAGIHVGVLKSNDMAQKIQARFPGKDAIYFKKNVDFVTSPQFFIDIYVRDEDPEVAAAIANAYVDAYRDFHDTVLRRHARGTLSVLESRAAELRQAVAAKSGELRAFQRDNDLVSTSAAQQLYVTQVSDFERQRAEYAAEIQALRERFGVAQASGGPDNPALRSPRLDNLRKLETKQAALEERLARLHAENRASVGKTVRFETLETERRDLLDMLSGVERNLAEARLQSDVPKVEIIQVQTAQPPKVPSFPIITLNAIVAFILGFGAGCYNALLLEYLKRLRIERLRRNLDDGILKEVPV